MFVCARFRESVNVIRTGGAVHDIAVAPSVPGGLCVSVRCRWVEWRSYVLGAARRYRGVEYTRAGALVGAQLRAVLAPGSVAAGVKRGAVEISGSAAPAPRTPSEQVVLSEFVTQFDGTGPLTFYILATDGVRRVVKVSAAGAVCVCVCVCACVCVCVRACVCV
jgi:hypothetical protein